MKLPFQTRYLLYILAVHAVIVALIFVLLREKAVWFIAAEVGVAISLVAAIWFFRQFREPSEFIASGIEAIRDQDFTVKFVPTGNEAVDELIRVYNLMIDQLRLERTRQREQQFFLENLVEAAPIAILIFDFDGRISAINPAARALLDRKLADLLGKFPDETGHPLLQEFSTLQSGEARTVKISGVETYKLRRSHFMDRGFARDFLLIEELTRDILESEKAAYGKVIRMMAHEVNNSIGAVNSILDVSQAYVEAPDVQHALRVAHERNQRLGTFMRRFADVVRLPAPNLQPADVTDLARNVTRFMQPLAEGRGVSLRFESSGETVRRLDVEQFEQVLVNVLKNALEACQPGETVETVVSPDALTVRDNGRPIADDVAARLFNPFFSTKPDGQGIGLTLTREILLNHGFAFSLRTGPDGWTAFVIQFN
jgi:signal transduction histidine kinase